MTRQEAIKEIKAEFSKPKEKNLKKKGKTIARDYDRIKELYKIKNQ